MFCSTAKVSKIYQNVRAFCRENPKCKSLYEARTQMELKDDAKWGLTGALTKKEERALERMCDWLGV